MGVGGPWEGSPGKRAGRLGHGTGWRRPRIPSVGEEAAEALVEDLTACEVFFLILLLLFYCFFFFCDSLVLNSVR